MAGTFTDYLEDKVLKHVFTNTAYTAPTTIHIGLFTAAPSDTGGGTEVSTVSTGYTRQTVALTVSGTNPTLATNGSAVEWSAATASWGTITHIALFDAASAGNMLAWADLTTSRLVNSGDIFRIPVGDLDITLS